MALGSNAPRCAAGDCPEQLRFDVHQLHHEGLLMVSRVLVVNPERWRDFAWNCVTRQGIAMRSTRPGFNRGPGTMALHGSAPQNDTLRGSARNSGALG